MREYDHFERVDFEDAARSLAGYALAFGPHAEILKVLTEAPESVNPAITLAAEVMELETRGHREDIEKLLRSVVVERAIIAGEREGRAVLSSLAACGHAPPVASKTVPVGF